MWQFYDPFRFNRNRAVSAPAQAAAPAGPSAAEVRQRLTESATALRDAFKFLSQHLRRISHPTLEGTPGSKALARATVLPLNTFSIWEATREINESPSAIQSSISPLNLDISTPEAKSVLQSLAAIGLDVSSPERSTVLQSSSQLGLDTTTPESASVIQSTGEANTMPTSYEKVQVTFGTSSSVGNLTGTYQGTGAAANATSLTLTVSSLLRNINNIPNLVSVEARDQNGTNLGTYRSSIRAGDTLSLGSSIGLSISFSAGALQNGSSTTFAVSNTTSTDINPDAIFNAANINDRPRFENGAQVTAGSFAVNGTAIQVFANDSVNSVLERINQTVSGVIASYENDRLVIRSDGPSEDNITLANDTSGFFTALKLNGATTARGNVRDDLQIFSKTAQFASVNAGSFRVNGQTISVDPLTDNLQTILSRINSSEAGVTATYDAQNDRVVLTSNDPSEDPIVVDNDTSGLLNVVTLSTINSALGNVRDDRQVLSKVAAFSAVQDGSFRVNGIDISVDIDTDTLEGILARINESAAGVTATYDSTADKLVLTSVDDSEDEIVLSNDTSGFLAATKVEGASTVRGNIRDDQQILERQAQFASVAAGSFQINGVTIGVDPGADSLNSIIAAINSSAAGVTASYDPVEDRLVLDPGGNALVLENDSSGFLEAAGISTGLFATRVNENAAFNGTSIDSPHFDAGLSVHAGSFTVNGVEITVDENDSILSVLERINNSAAGVTASFNSATETVTLRANQSGPRPIDLGPDSSGFLAAVKLDSANFTLGTPSSERPLRDVLPSVPGGVLEINQQLIDIQPETDTLATIAQKLNELEGVEAFLDEATGALTIRSEREGGSLTITDYSGAMAALGINEGVYTGQESTLRTVQARGSRFQVTNREQVVDRLVEAYETANQAFALAQSARGLSLSFRDDVQDALRDALDAISDARQRGLTVLNEPGSFGLKVERSLLSNALRQNARILDPFFKGNDNLPDALDKLAGRAQQNAVTAAPAPVVHPAPTAAIAGDMAEEFHKVASASHLSIIDSAAGSMPPLEAPTGALTPPAASPVVQAHESDSSQHMESARNFSYTAWGTSGAPAGDDSRWSSAAYLA